MAALAAEGIGQNAAAAERGVGYSFASTDVDISSRLLVARQIVAVVVGVCHTSRSQHLVVELWVELWVEPGVDWLEVD